MALDLSRFAKAFFEEAQEHLYALESLLIAVDINAPDDEALNAIFRAVHSVKGGAAAFGHTALTAFTHEFESILDRVRKRKLVLTKRLVDLCLTASDIMRRHLAALEQERAPDLAELAGMQEALIDIADNADRPIAHATPAPTTSAHVTLTPINSTSTDASRTGAMSPATSLQVAMRLMKTDYADTAAINNLLADIRGLGEVASHDCEAISATQWELRFSLNADIAEDELRESLEFLAPADSIYITSPSNAAPFTALPSVIDARDTEDENAYEFFAPLEDETGNEPDVDINTFLHKDLSADIATNIEKDFIAYEAYANAPVNDIALASLADASSIRVNVAKVDQLINLVGELVIAEAMLVQSAADINEADKARLAYGLSQLERNTRELQEAVLAIRMLPISFVFSRLPRMTRDLADRLSKEVELEMYGEDTELDKSVIEKIADPLTHLVRNALDHGIETPDERQRHGKPRVGLLSVRAAYHSGGIMITVADDGAGLNRERIVRKANELGLAVTDQWRDDEIWPLIFTPGFSTAESVSDISGRGVGMDVVWQNVHSLGGTVDIASNPGTGTTITIRLPLTLAILDGMSISVCGETYILPLAHIAQSMQPEAHDLKTVNSQEVVKLRDEYLPITSLQQLFNLSSVQPAMESENSEAKAISDLLVILDIDGKRAALRVDALLGQHQVVLKSIEANYRRVKGLSGATIMGDGRVAFILDAAYIVGVAHTVDIELNAKPYG